MTIFEIIVLAIVQGITEFLPISSSGHLILIPKLIGLPDQGLAFDVAVHVGTLGAVICYFWKSIWSMTTDWCGSLVGKGHTAESKLAWYVIIATLPAGFVGVLIKDFVEANFRSVEVIAAATVGFGLILLLADKIAKQQTNEYKMSWKTALLIGVSQILALIPGTSRSGITMTSALMLGLTREAAARFSFLLSIPTILGAGIFLTKDAIESGDKVDWVSMGLGAGLSFVSAYACIYLFLSFISRIGMTPFVFYRVLLGAVLVAFFL